MLVNPMIIQLLIIACVLVILGYYVSIYVRYLLGRFQYNVIVPGHYVFPKRIKKKVRSSVIMLYKSFRTLNFIKLQDAFEDKLKELNIRTLDLSINRSELDIVHDVTIERHFRYFIFLYEASLILGVVNCFNNSKIESTKFLSEVNLAKFRLRKFNDLFSKRYVTKIISITERYIVVAEIIHRIMLKNTTTSIHGAENMMAYNDMFYYLISRDSVIDKHSALIMKAVLDEDLINMVKNFNVEYSAIYNNHYHSNIGALFHIYVCLLTDWLSLK